MTITLSAVDGGTVRDWGRPAAREAARDEVAAFAVPAAPPLLKFGAGFGLLLASLSAALAAELRLLLLLGDAA